MTNNELVKKYNQAIEVASFHHYIKLKKQKLEVKLTILEKIPKEVQYIAVDSNAKVRSLLEKLIAENKATPYDKLYYLHKAFIKQEWISVDDMGNIRNIYKSYHALGGNGSGTALFQGLEELPGYSKEEEKKWCELL